MRKVANTYYAFENDQPDPYVIQAQNATSPSPEKEKSQLSSQYNALNAKMKDAINTIHNKNLITDILIPSGQSMKAAGVLALVGVVYALAKKKSWIAYGALGGVAGTLGYNIYDTFIATKVKSNKTDK